MKKYNERILCIAAKDDIKTLTQLKVAEIHVVDRNQAEKDENYRQIIPYVNIFDLQTDSIFLYKRVGGDPRLLGNYSVGVGGHMNSWTCAYSNFLPFEEVLKLEAMRELDEELEIPMETLKQILKLNLLSIHENLIVMNDSPIDKMHIGVPISIFLGEPIAVREKEILEGRFVAISEASLPEVYNNLETWSKKVIDNLNFRGGDTIKWGC